jgi:hypothetical protein
MLSPISDTITVHFGCLPLFLNHFDVLLHNPRERLGRRINTAVHLFSDKQWSPFSVRSAATSQKQFYFDFLDETFYFIQHFQTSFAIIPYQTRGNSHLKVTKL